MSYTELAAPRRGFGDDLPTEGCFLIPGRIPTIGRPAWPQWREAAQAIASAPLPLHLGIGLTIRCVFGYEAYQAKTRRSESEWSDLLSIPTLASMTEAVMLGLRGSLFIERKQVTRLEIAKERKLSLELQAVYGLDCRRGVTLVEFKTNH